MVAFQVQQALITRQAGTRITRTSEHDLCIITVSNTAAHELAWQSPSEFVYKGHRYDIAYAETKNNVTQYHCINDTREEELFSFFDEWIQKNLEKNTSSSKTTQSMFYFLSIISAGTEPLVITPSTQITELHYSYVYHYTAPTHGALTPPPWQV